MLPGCLAPSYRRYDVDESGTIDTSELEDVLFDCGVKLTPGNIEEARAQLGLKRDGDDCNFKVFKEW